MRRAARRPLHSVPAWLRYGAGLGMTGTQLVTRAVGVPLPEPIHPEPGDARFRDPTWQDNIVVPRPAAGRTSSPTRLIHELVARGRARGPRGTEGGVRGHAARRRARAHQLPAHQPARAEARVRDRRHERRARRCATSCTTSPRNDGWPRQVDRSSFDARAATSRPRPGRSCSATSSSRCCSTTPTDRRGVRAPAARDARRGSTATTSPTSRRARAWSSGRSRTGTPRSR